jgi:hypothetical protein
MARNSEFQQGILPGVSAVGQPLNIVPGSLIKKVQAKAASTPEQLAMWKTAGDITTEYEPLSGDVHPGELAEDVWARKAMEASLGSAGNARNATSGETLAQSIKREGIKHPVTLEFKKGNEKPEVLGGHHRIAASLYDNPDNLVPVTYSENLYNASTRGRRNHSFHEGSGPDLSAEHQEAAYRAAGILG